MLFEKKNRVLYSDNSNEGAKNKNYVKYHSNNSTENDISDVKDRLFSEEYCIGNNNVNKGIKWARRKKMFKTCKSG